ncbi:amidohydrolase family protein [Paracoccus aminophilus]|uniref:Alkylphosphonate utilization protein n=1 Tax=Paracoccus aminophilus JCM 7686 TaxID=1367847 RepID=S5YDJ9_PARAH|nr:alkylphosphonate utilization protein [Paracoccus aminophilus]AGT09523.1 alkylphosphonate utilization protein [Paracoccus aminophilus JCM 7686]
MRQLPPLRLTGATILRDGELRQRSVAIERGRISKGPLPAVELDGYLILPGIIDLMGEIPAMTAPSTPTTLLRAQQVAAAQAGITTGWIALPWSWNLGPDGAARTAALLIAMNHPSGPVDLRPALRVEVSRTSDGARLIDLIGQHRPKLIYFENRREALVDLRLKNPTGFEEAARQFGLSAAGLSAALDAVQSHLREIPRHLCRVAEAMDAIGGSYGSLDDAGGDVRETYSMIGARLATCPLSYSAAAVARAMDNPVLLAPRSDALANDLIRSGMVSGLVSRGEGAEIAQRALALSGADLAGLPKIWPLVSSRPAEICGLADRGTLDHGRRADLVIIRRDSRQVEATICAGRLAYAEGEAKARFDAILGGPDQRATAAE